MRQKINATRMNRKIRKPLGVGLMVTPLLQEAAVVGECRLHKVPVRRVTVAPTGPE
jgi:hypothetical protein